MKTNKKMIVIVIAVAAVCVAGGASVFFITPDKKHISAVGVKTPKPAEQTNKEMTEFFQSEQFQSLDPNDRRDYARQAMRQMRNNNVEGYFETPENQRVAYLDEVIDSTPDWREMFRGQRGDRDRWRSRDRENANGQRRGGRGRRAGRGNPERLRERAESRDPAQTAKRVAFRQAMRKRMKQRGIESRWSGRNR
ncbi:MAG: hypothetical protein FVQ80_12865 [Planctomycetes bacterium]|nr:hypothetical protein [Planctomycetota bacterium]